MGDREYSHVLLECLQTTINTAVHHLISYAVAFWQQAFITTRTVVPSFCRGVSPRCVGELSNICTVCLLNSLEYKSYKMDIKRSHTVVIGWVTNNDEKAYREEVGNQPLWCKAKTLLLNFRKTKGLV